MHQLTNKNYYAVIMAGGIGSRFWPVSTSEFPKQFHDMLGTGDTLIQKTFKRLNKFKITIGQAPFKLIFGWGLVF